MLVLLPFYRQTDYILKSMQLEYNRKPPPPPNPVLGPLQHALSQRLPDVANKNTQLLLKFEFQVSIK